MGDSVCRGDNKIAVLPLDLLVAELLPLVVGAVDVPAGSVDGKASAEPAT